MLLFKLLSSSLLNKLITTLLIDSLYANRHMTPIIISGKISKRSVTCMAKFDSVKSMSSNTVIKTKKTEVLHQKC